MAIEESGSKKIIKSTETKNVEKLKNKKKTGIKKSKIVDKTVIKLNNIPHGFYEDQLRKYFTQFGQVLNVVLIRSKKTHKSRGFGFVEFKLPQVAKAAADAMHNYLFFNQVLKCRQINKNDLPKHLLTKKYKGPTSVELNKRRQNVDKRDLKKLCQHYKKIIRTQNLLKKLNVHVECHVINNPCEGQNLE